MKIQYSFLLFIVLFFNQKTTAQTDTSRSPNRLKAIVLPVAFYTPDTKFGGGGAALLTFNFRNDSLRARRSSVTVGAVYTQLNQFLLYFPFQLFPENQKYWISGEVGFFKYVFNFFGIGSDVPTDYIEKYDATFPRIRLNISRKIRPNLYLGLRYAFDDFNFTRRAAEGILIKNELTGANGGRVSGGGLVVNYDSRDALFFPTKGWVVEGQIYTEGAYTGSDFSYQRLAVDASKYYKIGQNSVLAFNGVASFSTGDVPFHQMPVIGGTKKMRGYFEGKYRDNNLLMLQSEYRFPLFWRFGAVVFGGIGEVSDKFYQWNVGNIRYNFGGGVRLTIDKLQKINIRADYGLGYKSSGFYLTIGEAF